MQHILPLRFTTFSRLIFDMLIFMLTIQGNSDTPDVSLGRDISTMEERLKFQAQEISRMSTIHDKLMEREK